MEKLTITRFARSMVFGLALVFMLSAPASAITFQWSGTIDGEDPSVTVAGTAEFTITGSTLEIYLTNTGTDTITAIGQILTILTWDMDSTAALTVESAMINTGSTLIGIGATSDMNLSGEWAYKDDVSAGDVGSYGLSSVGDLLDGVDSFGRWDIIRYLESANEDMNLWGSPLSPNGISGGIVGDDVDLSGGGFLNAGPMVQNSMLFTFSITGNLSEDDFSNVEAFYGTDGAALLVPEPNTLLLLGLGLIGIWGWTRRFGTASIR